MQRRAGTEGNPEGVCDLPDGRLRGHDGNSQGYSLHSGLLKTLLPPRFGPGPLVNRRLWN
jgi:hypothetical protein